MRCCRLMTAVAVLAGLFGCDRQQQPTTRESGAAQAVSVEPKSVVVEADTEDRFSLNLHNHRSSLVQILEVKTTCSCTTADSVSGQQIDPGQMLRVDFAATRAIQGDRHSVVTIQFKEEDVPELQIPVLLKGRPINPPFLSAFPRQVEIVTRRADEVGVQAITVRVVELTDQPPWLGRIETPEGWLAGEVEYLGAAHALSDRIVERNYRIRLTTQPHDSSGVKRVAVIGLGNSSRSERLPPQIEIVSVLRPNLRAIPSSLFVPITTDSAIVRRRIRVLSESETPLLIVETKTSASWLAATPSNPNEATNFQDIDLEIDARKLVAESSSGTSAEIQITTNDTETPVVSVRVVVAIR